MLASGELRLPGTRAGRREPPCDAPASRLRFETRVFDERFG